MCVDKLFGVVDLSSHGSGDKLNLLQITAVTLEQKLNLLQNKSS